MFREFSKETEVADIPYYPKRLDRDRKMLDKYRSLAEGNGKHSDMTPKICDVSFLGRLATYRYMDMEAVIAEALTFADTTLDARASGRKPPTFPNKEE